MSIPVLVNNTIIGQATLAEDGSLGITFDKKVALNKVGAMLNSGIRVPNMVLPTEKGRHAKVDDEEAPAT